MTENKWELICSKLINTNIPGEIIDILLKNRGFTKKNEKEEFINPTNPFDITLDKIGISASSLRKSIDRIKKAIDLNEEIIIYGDYDADGVCSTAILWETLFALTKNVLPYLPNRFTEGYGINSKSIEKIRIEHPSTKLIITVDNGIVAFDAVKVANSYGIDVIITDHHSKEKDIPKAFSIVHTNKLSGSGVSYVLAREIKKSLGSCSLQFPNLELAAIGTIADQLPLTFANRSIAKYGIEDLNKTKRPGLKVLFKDAKIEKVGIYDINYVIAPRINAMGRMKHAIDSLRLICTNNVLKAREFSEHLGRVNRERQEIVEEVVSKVTEKISEKALNRVIVISGEFHEGVIGLAAGKLVEKYYLPSVVISIGNEISKASARSISGFNIIEAIRKVGNLIEGGGGHEMAAGFSIKTKNIGKFEKEFNSIAEKLLTEEMLVKKIKIDLQIDFQNINEILVRELKVFDPTGIGNPTPTFITRDVNIIDAKTVGAEEKHLKMYIEKGGYKFNAIGFNFGKIFSDLSPKKPIDIVYSIEENIWNGNTSIQLNIKDIRSSK